MGRFTKVIGWCKVQSKWRVPLLKVTLSQAFILLILTGAGSAAVYSVNHKTGASNPATAAGDNTTGNAGIESPCINGVCTGDSQPAAATDTTAPSTSVSVQHSTPVPATPISTDTNASDWLAKYNQCDTANNAAGDKYSVAFDNANNAYNQEIAAGVQEIANNSYLNEGQKANLSLEYSASAKSKYNAIIIPAYNEYVGTVNSLKAQGCQIVQVYTDTSWK